VILSDLKVTYENTGFNNLEKRLFFPVKNQKIELQTFRRCLLTERSLNNLKQNISEG
jgi:hypothetical protein